MVWITLRNTAAAAATTFALATGALAATPANNATPVAIPVFATAAATTNPFAAFSTSPALSSNTADAASSSSALPDAPDPQMQQPLHGYTQPQDPPVGHPAPLAPLRWKYIPAGYAYHSITGRDKILIGARDLYSIGNISAGLFSAGYEQLTNGSPNYGNNSTAFAKRLGAAAIRETSEGVFTDMVFANLYHQDPRFFAEGPTHSFAHRVVYAASRVFITRNDSGKQAINYTLLSGYAASVALQSAYYPQINYTLLSGYAASVALQSAYYPQINRNFRDSASEYGGSIGGAALGYVIDEFVDQVLQHFHFEKRP